MLKMSRSLTNKEEVKAMQTQHRKYHAKIDLSFASSTSSTSGDSKPIHADLEYQERSENKAYRVNMGKDIEIE